MPGTWVWTEGRYAWRPGHWMTVRPDWDWIPAHYVWAPRGYVFVDGYWDHAISRRGVLYAPVHFDAEVYARHEFSYSPVTVINTSVFSDHLFVRPQYDHYYFGDYYAASYRDSGFYASFSYQSGRQGYDPIYAHERWQHRQDPEWDRHVQADFEQRRDHEDARPRRTLAAQVSFGNTDARRADRTLTLAASLEQVSHAKDGGVRLRTVEKDERQQVAQRGKEVQRFREERQRSEIDSSADKPPSRSQPVRVKALRSPIAARPSDKLGKDESPPDRPESPKPDTKVERKARKSVEKREHPPKP